jgi:hypothetical protein
MNVKAKFPLIYFYPIIAVLISESNLTNGNNRMYKKLLKKKRKLLKSKVCVTMTKFRFI